MFSAISMELSYGNRLLPEHNLAVIAKLMSFEHNDVHRKSSLKTLISARDTVFSLLSFFL